MAKDLILEKLKEHDKEFGKISKRFDFVDQKIDGLIKKVLDHDDNFQQIDDKIKELNNNTMNRMDELLVYAQRMDQERIFTFEIFKRLEGEVSKIKKILKIA